MPHNPQKQSRQIPSPAQIFELLKFKKPTFDATDRRLQSALTIADLRLIAKRRTPKAAFDYTDGAAEQELSLARARQAFEDVEFSPSILRPAAEVDTSSTILGGPSALPFAIAPTGFTRLMQTQGELAGASAAGAAGIPFTLSTLGTTSIENVKAANPDGRNWFQLYVMRDRDISYGLVERAAAAGFDTLQFTVDTPVAGARLRDKRNGFSIPPALTLGTIVNAIPRPWWWWDFLTTPKLEFASLTTTGGTVGELLNAAMDPTISYDDLDVIRAMWPGKIVIKGVQNVEDSKKLADLGVDGIILSNHGGRQLDRAPIPFHLLPEVVRVLEASLRPLGTVVRREYLNYGFRHDSATKLYLRLPGDGPGAPALPGQPQGLVGARPTHYGHRFFLGSVESRVFKALPAFNRIKKTTMKQNRSEIRQDYIHNRVVIIAPGRVKRPHDFPSHVTPPAVHRPDCPFCPENESKLKIVTTYRTRGVRPWSIRVVKNIFPVVTKDNPKAYGNQEVVIETATHS